MQLRLSFLFLPLILAALSACQSTTGSQTAALTSLSTVDTASQAKEPDNVFRPETAAVGGGQNVDVYRPTKKPGGLFAFAMADKEKAPVLLYVHGGGWIKGERTKVYNLPSYAKERGYLLVSIDYRPVPKTSIDGQVNDVVRTIRWTRANIERYGGDPNKIVIMGHSAGSHLVSMVAARKLGGSIRGVIANDVQAYDLPEYYRLRKNSMAKVYQKAFGTNRANWVKYSPITYVKNGSGYPPFLILHSRSDYERRKKLASDFAKELRRKGARVTVFDGRNYTHGSIARGIGTSASVTGAVDRFLASAYR